MAEKLTLSDRKDDKLPKPNYQHDKRQRELEKKKKKEEKKQRKQTTEKPEEDAESASGNRAILMKAGNLR